MNQPQSAHNVTTVNPDLLKIAQYTISMDDCLYGPRYEFARHNASKIGIESDFQAAYEIAILSQPAFLNRQA